MAVHHRRSAGAIPSLARRVPLYLGVLLFAVLGTAILVEYNQLRSLLVQQNRERLSSATVLVARLLSEQIQSDHASFRPLADSLAAAAGTTLGDSLLAEALTREDDRQGVWIRGRDGSCIGVVRGPAGPTPTSACPDLRLDLPERGGAATGPIFAVGGQPRFRIAVGLGGDGEPGHALFEEAIASGQSGALIASLVARDAELLLGNAAGDLWTDFGAVLQRDLPLTAADPTFRFELQEDRPRIGAVAAIDGTPWVSVIHRDEGAVLAASQTFLAWITLSGAGILLAGTLLGGLFSRRITKPLVAMTRGAEAIAQGDYDRRVRVHRDDELGRLAAAFNTMAAQVKEQHATMEARVAERTRDLEEALRDLRNAQDAVVRHERLATIGQLAGGVAHELRNPLGVMSNAVYFLQAVNGDTPDRARKYVGILDRQVRISEKIIDDLMDFARVRAPERREVPVRDLVGDVLEHFEVPDAMKVETCIPEGVPPVWVDPVQACQIVRNLASNAVQAMEPQGGGTLRFSVRSLEGQVVLDVADTGPGIPPDRLQSIFEPLVTSKAEGTGLGLAICRILSDQNDIELSVRSEVGMGTSFEVSLPVFDANG